MTLRALHRLEIKGYKSIQDQALEFGPLNVFIGGNGAGKSNLVNTFRFLGDIIHQRLQTATGQAGGANGILYFGRKVTDRLFMSIEFRAGKNANIYDFELKPTAEDRFVFSREATHYHDLAKGFPEPFHDETWSGHEEARIAKSEKRVARYVREHLESYRIYHFHDTSPSARVKQTGELADNRFLRPDAGNLAAFLYKLKRVKPDHFQNIEEVTRQVAPFFGGFKLAPDELSPDKIRLEWQEAGSDAYFNASALSDGTLRFMCLATLLQQPEVPSLILIDEPELGLHPAAIQLLASLFQSAATRTQLIVATQSVTLVNQLLPEHVWIVDREEGASVFKHLKGADMSAWLEDYGLGELWEKNIFGGRP